MRLTRVNLIFRKELRDVLRDRRTLIATFVLPIILYPTFIIGFAQVMSVERGREEREVYAVAVVGRARAPDLFRAETFTENGLAVKEPRPDRQNALLGGDVQLVVEVPADFETRLTGDTTARLTVKFDQSNERSRRALERFSAIVSGYRDRVLRQRLRDLTPPRPDAFVDPVRLDTENLAPQAQVLLSLAGGVLVFLAVTMCLTGAFYPAVDTCAGEKERGTIETLLVSPATRTEIVFGKYVLILVMSLATAILNLLSMALTVFAMVRMQGSLAGAPEPLGVTQVAQALPSLVWVFVLLIPVAALFSALALALATFARSTKEAQYYMLPLYIIALPLASLGAVTTIDLSYLLDLVPVAGAAVVFRNLLSGRGGVAPHAVLAFVANFAYAAVAIRWTAGLFRREEVLFREAEEFDWRFWRWHSFRSADGRPTLAHIVVAFAGGLLLAWYAGSALTAVRQPVVQVLLYQLACIAAPPAVLAVGFRLRWRRTFRLRAPRPFAAILVLPLAAGMHVVLAETMYLLRHELPPPKALERAVENLLAGMGSVWWVMLAVAVIPALAEEFMFRGFVLSGLRSRMGAVGAVGASGLLFGLFHLNPYQFVFATLAGVVLAVLALRTGSLAVPILFHLGLNALGVLVRLSEHWPAWLRHLALAPNGEHYGTPALLAAGVLVAVCLTVICARTKTA